MLVDSVFELLNQLGIDIASFVHPPNYNPLRVFLPLIDFFNSGAFTAPMTHHTIL
mgnify:CR=1 FL=1